MPKRRVSGLALDDGNLGTAGLRGWQVMGLSLAAIAGDVLTGAGAVAFGVLAIGVIWALHRLHARAPGARSTADLIGSVLGAPSARAVGIIQFVAYVLLAAFAASSVGLLAVSWSTDPATASGEWLWPALSLLAVVMAALLVLALPTGVLAIVVTALAAFGLLVFFYVALAVIAKVASGTAPVDVGASAQFSTFGPGAAVIALAIGLVGFEIPTAACDGVRSVGPPLAAAMALAVVCAVTTWLAANLGTAGDFRLEASDLLLITSEMFGVAGSLWLVAGSVAVSAAGLLVLLWGARHVARSPIDGWVGLAVAAALATVLAIAISRGWADASDKLWGAAPVLLLVVYLLAAQANSRSDNANTGAWAVFVVTGGALVTVITVLVFGGEAGPGRWSVAVAAVIVGIAAASAVGRSGLPAPRSR